MRLHWLLVAGMLTSAVRCGCEQPAPRQLTPRVWVIPGSFEPGREPDGNTAVFVGPRGLVIVDTGRHEWQTRAILQFANEQKRSIQAIVNSHWHLDHTSGNRALKSAFPETKIYGTSAIDAAIAQFFPKSAAAGREYLQSPTANSVTAEDVRRDLRVMAQPDSLRPNVLVTSTRHLRLAGLPIELHLAPNAATDADLWVYSGSEHVIATGDLVTLPVPFLDTACTGGWQNALDAIVAKPFQIAIPGHGEPMSHDQVEVYRSAFVSFVACARSSRDGIGCADDWLHAVERLPGAATAQDVRASQMATSYVDLLRAHDGNSSHCKIPRS
jgi:glyoxylase-like metal-dependent hydrolase (beta-lactamase superfamily II)